jgi:hypothetical protein
MTWAVAERGGAVNGPARLKPEVDACDAVVATATTHT